MWTLIVCMQGGIQALMVCIRGFMVVAPRARVEAAAKVVCMLCLQHAVYERTHASTGRFVARLNA